VKPVGEPDAGNRHVRFDERGWETERCRMAQAVAPILDSTRGAERTSLTQPKLTQRPHNYQTVETKMQRRDHCCA
jgi:hypothetical protein